MDEKMLTISGGTLTMGEVLKKTKNKLKVFDFWQAGVHRVFPRAEKRRNSGGNFFCTMSCYSLVHLPEVSIFSVLEGVIKVFFFFY